MTYRTNFWRERELEVILLQVDPCNSKVCENSPTHMQGRAHSLRPDSPERSPEAEAAESMMTQDDNLA